MLIKIFCKMPQVFLYTFVSKFVGEERSSLPEGTRLKEESEPFTEKCELKVHLH